MNDDAADVLARTRPIVAGSILLVASYAMPWFDRGDGASVLRGWDMPALFVVGPLIGVGCAIVAVVRVRRSRHVDSATRAFLAAAIVLVGLVVVRTLIGSGAFIGSDALGEPGERVTRSWGLLVALHGPIFVIPPALQLTGVVALFRSAPPPDPRAARTMEDLDATSN